MSRVIAGLALAVAVLLLPACFSPHYASPGFYCSTDVSLGQGCPPGQECVGGRCTDKGSSATVGDLASSSVDLASTDLAEGSHDLASTSDDLATHHDFATPADLTVCVATGGDCTYHNNAVCCSGYCVYSTNTCK